MSRDDEVAPVSLPADAARPGGRSVGVLLSHGFTGSPYSLRPWAEHLNALGHGVEVPLLPGHGTTWRDLNRTGWDDWYSEVVRAYECLADRHDAVVAGGLSMGGALTLRLAAERPGKLAGLMLVNPAVATRRKDVHLLPVLKYVVPAFPAIANDINQTGQDERAYRRTPLRAAHSMIRGWHELRGHLERVTVPILYLRSTVDHVVDDASEQVILDTVSSTEITMRRLEHSYHVATLDNDAPIIFAESAAFIAHVVAGNAGRRPAGANP